VLFKICPLTMRTQTILLVRDTVVVLGLCPTDGVYRFRLFPRTLILIRDCQISRRAWGGNHAMSL